MTPHIRNACAGDGAACAAAWLDAARYYTAMDSRRFTVPDTDGLADFFEEGCAQPTGPDRVRLVAEVDGQVVGYLLASVHRPGPEARHQFVRRMRETSLAVDALVVAERARRCGVATALMAAVHSWAAARGAVVSTLDTFGGSPLSVPFYERIGYARFGILFDRELAQDDSVTEPVQG